MTDNKKNLVLAIETGTSEGSLSLFLNNRELSFFKGSRNISKSEDLLLAIDDQLRQHSYSSADIKTLLVSDGPGSHTGLRIGHSIALGIQNAVKCDVHFISILDAMSILTSKSKNVICCINLNKTDLAWKQFEITENSVKSINNVIIQKKDDFTINNQFEYLVDGKLNELFNGEYFYNVENSANCFASILNSYFSNKLNSNASDNDTI